MRAVCLSPVLAGLLLWAAPAPGQTVPASVDRPAPQPGFITRYNFHLNAAALGTDDERFNWDADFGGDIDLVDFGRGRVNILANYEIVLGEQLRSFDPNQASYTLDLLASARVRRTEIGGVFHHVSRHLSDRAKPFAIDWNMVGVHVSRATPLRRGEVEAMARVLWTVERSFVDYDSELSGVARVRYPIAARLTALVSGSLGVVDVDERIAQRHALVKGSAEAGLRISGAAADLELFLAVERRIDPHPFNREARSWALAGFRLVSR